MLPLDILAHITKTDINNSAHRKEIICERLTQWQSENKSMFPSFQVCAYSLEDALAKFKRMRLKSLLDRKFQS